MRYTLVLHLRISLDHHCRANGNPTRERGDNSRSFFALPSKGQLRVPALEVHLLCYAS